MSISPLGDQWTFSHVIKPQDPDKQAALIKEDEEPGILVIEQLKSIKPDPGTPVCSCPVCLLASLMPSFEETTLACPDQAGHLTAYPLPMLLSSIIIHLNDVHKWSRERIADWLESLDVDLSFKLVD